MSSFLLSNTSPLKWFFSVRPNPSGRIGHRAWTCCPAGVKYLLRRWGRMEMHMAPWTKTSKFCGDFSWILDFLDIDSSWARINSALPPPAFSWKFFCPQPSYWSTSTHLSSHGWSPSFGCKMVFRAVNIQTPRSGNKSRASGPGLQIPVYSGQR